MVKQFQRLFLAFGAGVFFVAHSAGCFTQLNKAILELNLEDLSSKLATLPEKEWQATLKELGLQLPPIPGVLEVWGSPSSVVAYRSYILKQGLGQRIAIHFEKASETFLASPEGQRIIAKSPNPDLMRQNMPQILLALASSGELSLPSKSNCSAHCQSRMGEKLYEQLVNTSRLESFSLEHEKVAKWVESVVDLNSEKPSLWKAMHTRVVDAKQNQQIRDFFEERGFSLFAEQYRYSGTFIQPSIVPLRFDSQATLGLSIRQLFASENSLCCGTSCGACPLGFPSILRDAQKNLALRNKKHTAQFKGLLKENMTVFSAEREVFESSLKETQQVLATLDEKKFGIFSSQDSAWLDQHFRRGVLEAEVDFLHSEIEMLTRHSRSNESLRYSLMGLLSDPALSNNVQARALLRALRL